MKQDVEGEEGKKNRASGFNMFNKTQVLMQSKTFLVLRESVSATRASEINRGSVNKK